MGDSIRQLAWALQKKSVSQQVGWAVGGKQEDYSRLTETLKTEQPNAFSEP